MRRRAAGVALAVLALGIVLGVGSCSDDEAADDPEPTTELVADFTHEVDYRQLGPTSCPLKDVQLTDESTGDPETWEWSFSDGGTSTEPDPLVTTRIHEATLTVTRGDETDSVTKPVQIVDC